MFQRLAAECYAWPTSTSWTSRWPLTDVVGSCGPWPALGDVRPHESGLWGCGPSDLHDGNAIFLLLPKFPKALPQRTRAWGSSFSCSSSASRHLSSLPRRAANSGLAGPLLRAERRSALITSRAPRLHCDSAFRSEGTFLQDYNTFLVRQRPRVASRTSHIVFPTWCDTLDKPDRIFSVLGIRKNHAPPYP